MFAGWRPAAPAVVRPRRLAVVDRELDCGEDQHEQDRDGRCRDGVNVHLRVSPLGEPSWSEFVALAARCFSRSSRGNAPAASDRVGEDGASCYSVRLNSH